MYIYIVIATFFCILFTNVCIWNLRLVTHTYLILKKGKCGFEHVSIGRGICEGKSGIWYTWIAILCFQNNELLINWMYFHITHQSQLAVQSIPSQKNKSWVWKDQKKKKKNLFHKKGQKRLSSISQKNKMSGLFKNCQHNPLHTAPPSALSVNHRPRVSPRLKLK